MGRARLYEVGTAFATAGLALLAATLVLRLWNADLGVPLVYIGDANLYHAVVKSTLEHGWYLENANLGAPAGQELYELPIDSGATGLVALIHLFGLGTSNAAAAVNLFFLLSFPLVAVVAFLVLRKLSITRPVALACAVLYALAPYHFLRGEDHLYLSAYYAVPVAAYLVLKILAGDPLFTGIAGRQTAATLACCLLIATGGTYYAVFAAVLLIGASGVAAVLRRHVLGGLAAAAIVSAVLVVQFVPTLAHRAAHGSLDATKRAPVESEIFGLKVAELVLPLPTHRLDLLAEPAREYYSTRPLPFEPGATLGAVATIGFVWLIVVAVAGAVGRGREQEPLVRRAAGATILTLLIGLAGAASTLIAYLVTAQFRVWSRMSIVVAFFAILGAALALDRLRARLGSGRRGQALHGAIIVAVLVLGVADQTSDAFVPEYRRVQASYRSDRGFVRAIERRLPPGAMIYQLPYLAFPEAQAPRPSPPFFDYDPVRGYLHSDGLRWSYGAIKGGPDDWTGTLAPLPVRSILPGLAAVGFLGVYVDRFGYADRGTVVERALRRALGTPLTSHDGRLAFFDLREYAERLRRRLSPAPLVALRTAVLEPARIRWADDVWAEERSLNRRWRWTKGAAVELSLINPARREQTVLFSAALAAPEPGTRVLASFPGGASQTLVVGPRGMELRRTLRLPPGTSILRLASDAKPFRPSPPDPRPAVYFQILDPTLASTLFL